MASPGDRAGPLAQAALAGGPWSDRLHGNDRLHENDRLHGERWPAFEPAEPCLEDGIQEVPREPRCAPRPAVRTAIDLRGGRVRCCAATANPPSPRRSIWRVPPAPPWR